MISLFCENASVSRDKNKTNDGDTDGKEELSTHTKQDIGDTDGKKKVSTIHNYKDITFGKVALMAVLGVVLYHVITMIYIFAVFAKAAAGPFGGTLAVMDAMSEKYPVHVVIIQKMVLLPVPNLAAKRYYEAQRDFFLEAARNFELHPYWSTHNLATEDMQFREVVTER